MQLDFDIGGSLKNIQKLQKDMAELKKKLTGQIDDGAFDDLKDDVDESTDSMEKAKKAAKNLSDKLSDIGKKGATMAFNGLKKVASVSSKTTIAGVTAMAGAIGTVTYKATAAVAEFEQLEGGMKKIFDKANISQITKDANNAYKDLGLSASGYLRVINDTGATFASTMGDQKGYETARTGLKAISDYASGTGKNIDVLSEKFTMITRSTSSYQSIADQFSGILPATSKDFLKQAQSAGFLSTKYSELTKVPVAEYQEAVTKMLEKGVESLGLTGNTAAEAESTITGSLGMMKSSWENLLVAIGSGKNLDQCFDNMLYSVEKFGFNVIPVVERALGSLGQIVEKLVPVIADKLPALADQLLPPLLRAAVELTKGLIKALPSIVKTVVQTIGEILSEEFPALAKLGDFFESNGEKIAKFTPILLGLIGAFMAFKKIKSIGSFFSGIFGKSEGGGEGGGKGKGKGGMFKWLTDLAKMKTTSVLKGMANLAIIFTGFTALAVALMALSPYIANIGDTASLIKLIAIIGVLGLVGVSLAKFGNIAGQMKITTVLKGLANMAIMVAGMSALFLLVGAVSLINFDLGKIMKITLIIGVLGTVATILSVFAGLVGLIPVPVVALGLANMAIIIGGMSALFLLIGACSLLKFNLGKITKIIGIIALLGTVASVLSIFAGIVGLIPIPVVLAGLANMGLVLGGVTALILAFGKLSEIKGFTEFLDKGGETLKKVFKIIGEIGGSLIGGFGEAMSESLPKIGKNIGEFGENISPLFKTIKGVDMGGVGAFFTSLVGLLGIATGKDIIDGIKSFFGGGDEQSPLAKLGTELTDFASNAQGFFTTIQKIPAESFPKATELFKSLAEIKKLPKANKEGKTAISAIATDLSTFDEKTSGFFAAVKTYDYEKVNQLWESLKGADDVSKKVSEKVNKDIDSIVKKVSGLPKKMGDALKDGGKTLGESLVSMWKEAVKASVAPVNKLLSGANHILKEFGSKKRVIEWQPYAKGTSGHKGGNALVNDGRGAELIQMPNGRMFIPNGRNVFLPNAPKGMKVLSAERTAGLFGKKSPTFNYADGIGDIDIWSYYDNSKGLVDKITEGISYKGMNGFTSSIGKGIVSTFAGVMPSWVDKLFEENGQSISSYVASKGVTQWLPTVVRALKMEGQYSAANVARTLFQMRTESGGNPRAINLWDKNAKNGTPSKGLMQVIDPTFKAYAREGFNKNIYDPLSNVLASIRYATSRYGSLAKAYRGVGYASGVGEVKLPTTSYEVSYTPEGDARYSSSTVIENNEYSPQFNVNVYGSNDRDIERKFKQWFVEAMEDMFTGMANKNKSAREV